MLQSYQDRSVSGNNSTPKYTGIDYLKDMKRTHIHFSLTNLIAKYAPFNWKTIKNEYTVKDGMGLTKTFLLPFISSFLNVVFFFKTCKWWPLKNNWKTKINNCKRQCGKHVSLPSFLPFWWTLFLVLGTFPF